MAKRRNDKAGGKAGGKNERDQPSPHLQRHMALPGLATIAEYRAFCRQQGL